MNATVFCVASFYTVNKHPDRNDTREGRKVDSMAQHVEDLAYDNNPSSPRGPVIIVGSGRSGTSVLTWCLGQHPNILSLPETNWVAHMTVRLREIWQIGSLRGHFSHLGQLDWREEDFLQEFGKKIDEFILSTKEPRLRYQRKHALRKNGFSDEEIQRLEAAGNLRIYPGINAPKHNFQVVRGVGDPKHRWVDGTPENTFYAFGLSLVFPQARFIHLLRKPDAVARSLMSFAAAGSHGQNHDMDAAFQQWTRFTSHARKIERAFGNARVFRVAFEDFIADPRATLSSVLFWLGESFQENCLLPLNKVINSSQSEIHLRDHTIAREEANALYRALCAEAPPAQGEPEAYENLKSLFYQYCASKNRIG